MRRNQFGCQRLSGATIRWMAGKGGLFRDESGAAIRMAGVNIDITEKKEAEARILLLNEGLERRVAEVPRAPFEMTTPVLRASPHVDSTAEDLDQFAEALAAATDQVR